MAHIIQGNPSYTISLDDIDLNYFFRKIHLPKNGLIKPLWSDVGYGQNDYYEFEIVTEDNKDVNSEVYYDHNLICESYICHICNITVPKMYMKEHNQTTKHKVYLEIADNSLQRSRKHINKEFSHQKSAIRFDCYFCTSCSAAVATELEGHHEKTPGHLISVKHDNLLQQFLKYYLDRDNVEIDFELDEVKVFENLNKLTNANAKYDESGKSGLKTEVDQSSKVGVVLNSSTERMDTKDDTIENGNNEREKSGLKTEVDQSSKVGIALNSSTERMDTKDDTVENGIMDVVNEDANSIVEPCEADKNIIPNNDIEITISTNVNPSGEDQTLTKNNIVDIEINDEINDSILVNSNSIKTETDQTEVSTRRRKRKKKVKVDIVEVLKGYYKQISFGHKVEVIDEDTLAITPLNCHNNLLEKSTLNRDIVNVPVKNFHAYKEVDGHTRCLLCNINIDDVIESHIFSESHIILVMALIPDQNCIRYCSPRYSHCILCNEIVYDVEAHLFNNDNHKTGIVTFLFQNSSVKTYCQICEVEIESENFETHENSEKHRTNYEKKFPSLYNTKNVETKRDDDYFLTITDKPHEIFCKICKVHVPSKNGTQHLKGNNHIQKYDLIIQNNQLQICANGYYCDICKVNVPIDGLIDHIEGGRHLSSLNGIYLQELHDHLQRFVPSDNHVYCKVCQIVVAKDLEATEDHLMSAMHEDNFTKLMEENKLLKLDESGRYCLFCDKLLEDSEMEHIKSSEHRNAMEKSGKESSQSDIKIHPHLQTTDNPKELKCKVCFIAVPFLPNNIDEHVIGKNHKKNYNKMLNQFKKVDEMYFCEMCQVFLNEDDVVDHSCGVNNKEITEVKSNSDSPISDSNVFCEICKVSIPDDANIMEKHCISEEHLKNFSKIMNKDNYFFQLSTDSESVCSNSSPILKKDTKKRKAENKLLVNSETIGKVSEIEEPETTKSFLHDHMELTDTPGSLRCKVCKVAVPNSAHCVDVHVNGLKHKNKYETLMRDNKLNERPNCYYCGFCEILITKNLNIEHVFSERHIMNVATSMETQKPVPLLHYLMEKVERTKSLKCKICKIAITDDPIYVKNHLKSPCHTDLYEEFLVENSLVLKNEALSCIACKKVLEKGTEYEHVDSKKHKENISSNKYICNICGVAVPNHLNNIREHLRGTTHQSNISLISDWGT